MIKPFMEKPLVCVSNGCLSFWNRLCWRESKLWERPIGMQTSSCYLVLGSASSPLPITSRRIKRGHGHSTVFFTYRWPDRQVVPNSTFCFAKMLYRGRATTALCSAPKEEMQTEAYSRISHFRFLILWGGGGEVLESVHHRYLLPSQTSKAR